jgi:hypothetical protein
MSSHFSDAGKFLLISKTVILAKKGLFSFFGHFFAETSKMKQIKE